MNKQMLRWLICGALLIALGGLVGCSKPSPTQTPLVPSTTPAPPTLTLTPSPTFTPSPTPTPLPPQPPKLLGHSPERGEEQLPTAPLVMRFDQEMDANSVQAALHIEPSVKGVISWDDRSTLRFVPADKGFARNATYRVTVDTTATSARKLALRAPVDFRFQTIGNLVVSDVFPQPASNSIDTKSVIRIVFNRPIVSLSSVEEPASSSFSALPEWVKISPAIKAKEVWTNTSILTLEPTERLLPGTKYTLVVRAGLQDTSGALLPQDFTWSFTTALPDVLAVRPANGATNGSPYTAIRISFSQPMAQPATQERFTLLRNEATASTPGRFAWEENTLVYTPTAALEMGAVYLIRLKQGAPSLYGDAVIAQDDEWQFRVASVPQVSDIRPADGDAQVRMDEPFQITFSGPISSPTMLKGLSIMPATEPFIWWENENTVAHVSASLKPSTLYTLTLSTSILGQYGQPLQAARTIHFRTRPYDPLIQFNVPDRVGSYNAYAKPKVYLSYRNVSRVSFRLYTMPVEDMLALSGQDSWNAWQQYRGKQANLVRAWSENVEAPLNQTGNLAAPLTAADGKTLSPGLYYLEATTPEITKPEQHLLMITDTNLALKSTQDSALVWATDLRDGLPVAGVHLLVYNDKGRLVAEADTDRDGLAQVTFPKQDPWTPLIVLGRRGAGLTAVMRSWSNGLEAWDFRFSAAPTADKYRGYFYTERRIYRPGQKVYFKGILRNDDDGRYALPPAGSKVQILIMDSQGRQVWDASLPLNEMGTVNGEFSLGPDATLGYYSLQARYGQQLFNADFQVAEYRKPEFQVQVTLDKPDYIQGAKIQGQAEATFFFGGPVSKANVHWRVMRQGYAFDRWQGEGSYGFTDYEDELLPYAASPLGELVTEGDGQTDAQGRFAFSLIADIAQRKQSQTYAVEVSVVDLNNQEVTANSLAIVHKGDFYIGLAPTSYVGTVGQEQTLQAITVDTQGLTRTNQSLQVVFYKHEWYSVQQLADDGNYYWTSKVRDTAVATQTVKTDALGYALASFVPQEGGVFRALATGEDTAGNVVRSSAYLWVSAEEFVPWRQDNNDRLALVADKKLYVPGETAQILIPSPYQGTVTALLTIERGHILEHRLITLKSNSERLSLPVLPEYAPNVYVSVVIVKGMDRSNPVPGFKVGYVQLVVSAAQQELAISITPDRSSPYRPRDQVTYQIRTLDYLGHGVPAEMSLQLVDLAVESLTGPDTRSIADEFYRQRGLGVATATTLAVSVDRHNLERLGEGKGGGGGPTEGPMLRQFLPDTAFWAPTVATDSDGKATVTVSLPDNLTTWRMTAQAVTAQTLVGRASTDITTSLEVMVRPVTPRFMVIGDKPLLGAVVHNNTSSDQKMEVSLAAQGLAVQNGRQTVSVPARGRVAVSWPTVVSDTASATLQFAVVADRLTDAISVTLPVYHPSTPEVVGTAGQLEGQTQLIELVRVPEQADRALGELSILLETSLAAGMNDGLRYLQTYPYDCAEQAVSRFLPNVVTYRALHRLGVTNTELEEQLPEQVGIGLQRLYALQNDDGGWGWWRSEASNPMLSAYAVLGLVEARRAQFGVDEGVLDRGLTYLTEWLDQQKKDTVAGRNTRAMVLYVLAEAGKGDLGRTVALYDSRSDMALYARGYLAMALRILAPDEPSRLNTLVSEFADAAILSASGIHWEETTRDVLAMNSDTRSTAILLRALVRLQPDNKLLPNIVRWLMQARSAGHWETTQETAWSILALTDYMAASGELKPDYGYSASVNGRTVAAGQATTATVTSSVATQTPLQALLRPEGDTPVILQRTASAGQQGTGKLYYSISLRYFLPAEQIKPLDRGIIVLRQYSLEKAPGKSITAAAVNDTILVKLTVIAPHDLYHLVLEDPLPAGAEAIDTSLRTTSTAVPGPEFQSQAEQGKSGTQSLPPWASYWPSHTEMRDERVALFAPYLPAGTYEYTYALRCTTPGEYKVMPAVAYEMYFADVFGRSAGAKFTIASGQ
jgi:alpha-2-macroglobulin